MKQAQNARKQRGRPTQRKGGKPSGGGNRTENKVRGNPKQLLEKYKAQARDSLQAGDRVTAEYYLQFADHYQRVMNEMQANRDQNSNSEDGGRRNRGRRGRPERDSESQDKAETSVAAPVSNEEDQVQEASSAAAVDGESPVDPAQASQPVEVHPELDLDGTEPEAKPKRRAPRRRRPAKPKNDGADAAAPEGDEAA